ncbi:unnamed protein product [Brachionus calyciflorus]|uniref:Uncharacterized protein n=1 Tax=Brachionus calyciflorus TaxID=104777 RepID=A0A814PS25_9BILA|nr:unnamed protein product [Brachionus calyciflorus]
MEKELDKNTNLNYTLRQLEFFLNNLTNGLDNYTKFKNINKNIRDPDSDLISPKVKQMPKLKAMTTYSGVLVSISNN